MSDAEMLELVKAGGDAGWKPVWENVIVLETKNRKIAELMKKYSLTDGDLMGMLYEEMIGRKKIDLFRGEGSLWGWMRSYVRGYVMRADPAAHGEFSIEGTAEESDSGTPMEFASDDIGIKRDEVWLMTHRCFHALWSDDPIKAYVHILKTKFRMSSEEIRSMLDISSAAAVDQIFSRSVKTMRETWVTYEKKGSCR